MTQENALTILKTGANVFLTGEPGAGKTHTINAYVAYLREHDIIPSITASTGIAATHIGGMTIHSWSGIGIKSTLTPYDLDKIASTEHIAKRIRNAKILIIDEISMLPPDTLSSVDEVCREIKQNRDSFGGMQVVFVGDFFQLPPIIKRQVTQSENQYLDLDIDEKKEKLFAYDSDSWNYANPIVCYLTEQHRQDDEDFLTILSAIRTNSFEESHLETLETRKIERSNIPANIPKLYSHNFDVDSMNEKMLKTLESEERQFVMETRGKEGLVATLMKGCLSPQTLTLRIGAHVMFTKNNPSLGFANGTLGEVIGFDSDTDVPVVRTKQHKEILVEAVDWSINENGKVIASISQIPLRLAWAITVHKSQGMSLDSAVMDLGSVFEYGQGYVALSRVRRLSGLHILGWNQKSFQVHPDVLEHDQTFRQLSLAAEAGFLDIPQSDLQTMQHNFLTTIGGSITKISKIKQAQKKETKDTYTETLTLLQTGKNIHEIADIREITVGTVYSHIEMLSRAQRIKKEELQHLLSSDMKNTLPVLTKAFKKLDTTKLTPLYEYFNEKYSYDDLRLARLFL